MTEASKRVMPLNEENLQQLGAAMAKAMQQIHEGARVVGRQAGEALAAISKRGSEWGGGR